MKSKNVGLLVLLTLGLGLVSCNTTTQTSSSSNSSLNSSHISSTSESSESSESVNSSPISSSSSTNSSSSSSSSSSSVVEEKKEYALSIVVPHFTYKVYLAGSSSTAYAPIKDTLIDDASKIEEGTKLIIELIPESNEVGEYFLEFPEVDDGVAYLTLDGSVGVQFNVEQNLACLEMPSRNTTLDFTSYVKDPIAAHKLTINTGNHLLVKAYIRESSTYSEPALGRELSLDAIPEKTSIVLVFSDNPEDEGNYVLRASDDITINGINLYLSADKTMLSTSSNFLTEDLTLDLTKYVGKESLFIGTFSVYDANQQKYVDLVVKSDGTATYNNESRTYTIATDTDDLAIIRLAYSSSTAVGNASFYFTSTGVVAGFLQYDEYSACLKLGNTQLKSVEYIASDESSAESLLLKYTTSNDETKNFFLHNDEIILDVNLRSTTVKDEDGDDITIYSISKKDGGLIDGYEVIYGRPLTSNGYSFNEAEEAAGEYVLDGDTSGEKVVLDGSIYQGGIASYNGKNAYYSYDYASGPVKNLTIYWEDGVKYYELDLENKTITTIHYIDYDPFTEGAASFVESTSGIQLTFNNGSVTVSDPNNAFKETFGSTPESLTAKYTVSKSVISFTLKCEINSWYEVTTENIEFKLALDAEEEESGFITLTLTDEVGYDDWYSGSEYTLLEKGVTFTKVTK